MNQNQQQVIGVIGGVIGQVGCVNVLFIGFALGLGLLVDKLLHTGGIFTVLLMVGSVPIALYVTVRISLAAAVRAQELLSSKKSEEKTEA